MFRTKRVFWYGMTRTRMGHPIRVWADLLSHMRTGILYAYRAPYAYGTIRLFFKALKLILRQGSSSTNDGVL